MTSAINPLKDILCQIEKECMRQYQIPDVYILKNSFNYAFSDTEFDTVEKVTAELRKRFPNDPIFNIILI